MPLPDSGSAFDWRGKFTSHNQMHYLDLGSKTSSASVVSSLNFGCFFRLVLEIQCVMNVLFPFRVTPLCRSTLVDRYNNYFQCVIFVLAVTISHTDTPTTEDTPQHRDRVKAKLHARAKRARARAEPQS